jgi:hypothetical protein
MRSLIIVLLATIAMMTGTACGATSEGACVVYDHRYRQSWSWCEENEDQAYCTSQADSNTTTTFNAGSSCYSLGFTLHCPSDGSSAYRYPAFAPCP